MSAPPSAQNAGRITVEADGECPSRDAVMAALSPVPEGLAATLPATPPRVSDQGERFRVAAAGQVRDYDDPSRDCAERARAAAVFIALALFPPAPLAPPVAPPPDPEKVDKPVDEPPPPAVSATPGPEPEPSPGAGSGPWVEVGVAARGDGAPGTGAESLGNPTLGGEVNAAVGWGALGIMASAGLLASTKGTLSNVPVREQRFPLSASLVFRHRLSRALDGSLAGGVAVVPFTLRGEGLGTSEQATRVDVGARVALGLRFLLAERVAPFVGVHLEYFPRAYVLDVTPLGDLGTTGHLWLGAVAGLAFELAR